jgi:phosphopentomutase
MYFIVVCDSFGIGADGEAHMYGDAGSDTALSASKGIGGEKWSFLERLGLGNAHELTAGTPLPSAKSVRYPLAYFGAMHKSSPGKDTQTGHWEIAGIKTDVNLVQMPPEYPSFSKEITDALKEETGYEFLGNHAASGTVIIEELGAEHIKTGKPIIYTSADSVMQIAAHVDVIPLDELYRICLGARKVCDRYGIGRVIARPFRDAPEGSGSRFARTLDRRDFGIALPGESVFTTSFKDKGIPVVAVGKIGDIFNEQGFILSYHDKGNDQCLRRMTELVNRAGDAVPENSLVFVNLVDTDTLYGHRRDPEGYGREVSRLSRYLEGFCGLMHKNDILYFTADHGCDPGFAGTDHTREYVPLLVYVRSEQNEDAPGKQPDAEARCLGVTEGFDWCVKDILRRETGT